MRMVRRGDKSRFNIPRDSLDYVQYVQIEQLVKSLVE
jgi:hypothetical protein